jgi:DNA-binding response OmpR family regulator
LKVLIAEDDPTSQRLLRKYLESQGYQVVMAVNGAEAVEAFKREQPDLVLLDVMMPKVDGWGVLNEIRVEQGSSTPVIMVTVKDSTEDKVRGLSAGVDDYVTKPFDLRELQARIEAVMRRYKTPQPHIKTAALEIDDEKKVVKIHGKTVELSPKEYDLLKLLASNPGKVFSHQEILKAIWSESEFASSEDVKKYVYLLRKGVERDPENPELVLTVRGFGYKLAS